MTNVTTIHPVGQTGPLVVGDYAKTIYHKSIRCPTIVYKELTIPAPKLKRKRLRFSPITIFHHSNVTALNHNHLIYNDAIRLFGTILVISMAAVYFAERLLGMNPQRL